MSPRWGLGPWGHACYTDTAPSGASPIFSDAFLYTYRPRNQDIASPKTSQNPRNLCNP